MSDSFIFTKEDTLILKGVAICCMLMWHLFYAPGLNGELQPVWVRNIGLFGDSCVSMFLFASGYGLTVSYSKLEERQPEFLKFILKRLVKFLFNFWAVFFLFVPIGVFVFKRAICLEGSIPSQLYCFAKQLTAISGYSSYNAAWWFNGLIIGFYLLFPVYYYSVKYNVLLAFFLSLIIKGCSFFIVDIDFSVYVLPFIFGIVFKIKHEFIGKCISRFNTCRLIFLLILALVFSEIWLIYLDDGPVGLICTRGIYLYVFITIVFVLLIKTMFVQIKKVALFLQFLGKHSSNVYLTHSFFYFYWFPYFFLNYMSPLISFFILMGLSVLVSIAINHIKKILKWDWMQCKIISIIENPKLYL